MSKNNLSVFNGLILLAFVAVLLSLGLYGPNQRRYLAEKLTVRTEIPQQALEVWRTHDVKGRVLFHFARRNNARDDLAAVTAGNYLYRAMHENRIRTLYHIIPEQSWQEVAATLAKRPLVLREGNGFRLVIEGMPVHVMRVSDVRAVGEPVLVNIEAKWWEEKELFAIEELLRRKVLVADIVTVSAQTGEK